VVVVDKSDVLWTEPRDISLEDAKKADKLRRYGYFMKYLTVSGTVSNWVKDKDLDKLGNEINQPPKYEYEDGAENEK
jgi:hypothetical protein